MADSVLATETSPEGHSVHTKDRLLDTAERLFAEHGLQNVSTRDITHAASANVGAINYYFGGKEGLIEAIFNRRMAPLNQMRMEAFDALEKSGTPPTVEQLLDIMIRSAMEQCIDTSARPAYFGRLLGRALGEPGECIYKLKCAHFMPVTIRFHELLHRALPDLPAEELRWRILYVFGAVHLTVLTMNQNQFPEPWFETQPSVEAQIQNLIQFAVRGLRAP